MICMRFNQAAGLLDCSPAEPDFVFRGITTDSREVTPGCLFAALEGGTFDGHDYVGQARALGAFAVLVSRDVEIDIPVLKVDDVLQALGKLAGAWRLQCPARVVGITGSNGKTTVKEMVASILRLNGAVLATTGNFNNELGLPLTLFQLDHAHDFAVLEMGASKRGDIAYLGGIAKPDVAVITNVGPAHLEGFGDIEGVARAKGEIYAALPADGTAVMNFAEPWVGMWKALNHASRVLYFNGEGDDSVRAVKTGGQWVVHTPAGSFELHMSLPGKHNISNALAATAVCLALGMPLDDISKGLQLVAPVPGRLNVVESRSGWVVIDDTYNANPASLYAALDVLNTQRGEHWLVLGDMKELGTDSRRMHAEMGSAARSLGVQRLFALGEASAATADAFGDAAIHFDNREKLVAALREQLRPGIACLVKGSRSMGMEYVVKAISNGRDVLEVNG
jgi:UDP-N-acetylmuramoyl-tripeptide--D-alanyl-D-alanine ligase